MSYMTNKEAAEILMVKGFHFCSTRRDSSHCVHVVQTVPIACRCCWCGVEYRFSDLTGSIEVHGPHMPPEVRES
jgi:hypothetical protein